MTRSRYEHPPLPEPLRAQLGRIAHQRLLPPWESELVNAAGKLASAGYLRLERADIPSDNIRLGPFVRCELTRLGRDELRPDPG